MKTTAGQYIQKGFTLVELLIVIAILGILGAGVLVAIDPVDKINSANDAKVQNGVGSIASASEAYAAAHNGSYQATAAELVTYGELKVLPAEPGGTAYIYAATTSTGTACTTPLENCAIFTVTGTIKSKKYTGQATPKTRQAYTSNTGKSCQIAIAPAPIACP